MGQREKSREKMINEKLVAQLLTVACTQMIRESERDVAGAPRGAMEATVRRPERRETGDNPHKTRRGAPIELQVAA